MRTAAFGHCFRREAGGRGQASKWLYRLHQFSKVELFVHAAEEQSEAMFDVRAIGRGHTCDGRGRTCVACVAMRLTRT